MRSTKASPKPRTMTGWPGRRADRSLSAVKAGGRCTSPCRSAKSANSLLFVEFGVQVAEGEHHQVGDEGLGAAFEPHPLPPLARPADPRGAGAVLVHGDGGRQRGHGVLVHPAQVRALRPPAGEGAGVQAGPFGEGGPRAHRAVLLDGVVGEHGDVLGHGVHPKERRLVGPPDPSAARGMRVHQVDVEGPVSVQGRDVGGEPLQEAGPPRTGSYHHDGRAHRAPAEPRA